MKTYIGVKKIEAEPMTRGDYNIYRGWQIPADENPADEGYHIKYADGHESWSPKENFENTFLEKGKNLLNDTALLMKSEDYTDRFKAEYEQLRIRTEKLSEMLVLYAKEELPFKPKCPYDVLDDQYIDMCNYLITLTKRADIEGIKLEKKYGEENG